MTFGSTSYGGTTYGGTMQFSAAVTAAITNMIIRFNKVTSFIFGDVRIIQPRNKP